MKTIILAGGLGTRLAEETEVKPKPMVEIGGRPLLWHIMKIYSSQGFNEFFVALGYKSEVIKKFFLDYYALSGNMTINLGSGEVETHQRESEDWKVHLIETGLNSMTGGRIKRFEPYLKNETFMVTYGDGLADIDIKKLIEFHRTHGKIATITAVHPPARYGELNFNDDSTVSFKEKPKEGSWINGGFMVFEPQIFDYLKDDQTILERDTLEVVADLGQLVAYKHNGFWQCADTINDKKQLENLWQNGNSPWRVWV